MEGAASDSEKISFDIANIFRLSDETESCYFLYILDEIIRRLCTCARKEGGFERRHKLVKSNKGRACVVCVILIPHLICIKCYSNEIPCYLC